MLTAYQGGSHPYLIDRLFEKNYGQESTETNYQSNAQKWRMKRNFMCKKAFLESAIALIPPLTGISMAVYDGNFRILEQFERRYCFSSKFQKIYTAKELEIFLENSSKKYIYEIDEPMGSHLIIFKEENKWILLGPYVEDGWNESSAKSLLVKLGGSEAIISPYKSYRCSFPITQRDYPIKIALLMLSHINGENFHREIKTVSTKAEYLDSTLAFSDVYGDASIVNKRYKLEEDFIISVSQGETEKAYKSLAGTKNVSSGVRFISNDLKDQIVGAAIIRTLVRIGAKMAGLSPILIDSISQEYAQKMQRTVSKKELDYLVFRLIEDFCTEVRKRQKNNYSPCVRRAIDFMNLNLSKLLSISDIAEAAGIDKRYLAKRFGQETGMTMKQYLAKKRCEIAAELLMDRELSVQEIAAYVGYPDNNYFSKVFKTNFGSSPQDYRKSVYFF